MSDMILSSSSSSFCPSLPLSDVDECEKGTVCFQGQCLNTDGSYQCVCEAGYKFSADAGDCEGTVNGYVCALTHTLSTSVSIICHVP